MPCVLERLTQRLLPAEDSAYSQGVFSESSLTYLVLPAFGREPSERSNGHCHAAVPEKFANGIEWHSGLHKARYKMVAQIMPAKPCRYLCFFQQSGPGRLETRCDREYSFMVQVLLTPSLQRFESFVIQRDMTGVAGLC
jgi:hypothetical protein